MRWLLPLRSFINWSSSHAILVISSSCHELFAVTNRFSNSGIAGIWLDFSSVLHCPRTKRFSVAQALTIWIRLRFFPRSQAPRSVVPSIAMTCPSVILKTNWIQLRKQSCSSFGFNRANNRSKVSWEGIPFFSSRNPDNHSCLEFPKLSTSPQVSAPQMTAQIVIIMISFNLYSILYWARGSLIELKCVSRVAINEGTIWAIIWRMEISLNFKWYISVSKHIATIC